jgi:hypothetical protein
MMTIIALTAAARAPGIGLVRPAIDRGPPSTYAPADAV